MAIQITCTKVPVHVIALVSRNEVVLEQYVPPFSLSLFALDLISFHINIYLIKSLPGSLGYGTQGLDTLAS